MRLLSRRRKLAISKIRVRRMSRRRQTFRVTEKNI